MVHVDDRVQPRAQQIGLSCLSSFLRSHRPLRRNRWNHGPRFDGIPKIKLRAFEPSDPRTLQSQTSRRPGNRLPLNGLEDFSRATSLEGGPGPWTFGGGTALARVLDHRISYDVDVFLDSSTVLKNLRAQIHSSGDRWLIVADPIDAADWIRRGIAVGPSVLRNIYRSSHERGI